MPGYGRSRYRRSRYSHSRFKSRSYRRPSERSATRKLSRVDTGHGVRGVVNFERFLKTPFPEVAYFRHRYWVDYQGALVGAAARSNLTVSGNSLVVPSSMDAKSAQFLSDMANLYQVFRIMGCSIKVRFSSVTTETSPAYNRYFVSVLADAASGTSTASISDLATVPFCRIRGGNAGEEAFFIKLYAKTVEIFNIPKPEIFTDPNYAGTPTLDPVNQWYFHIFAELENKTVVPAGVQASYRVQVQVKWYTRWEQRRLEFNQ